jgi:hypothetical protein
MFKKLTNRWFEITMGKSISVHKTQTFEHLGGNVARISLGERPDKMLPQITHLDVLHRYKDRILILKPSV